MTKPIPVSPSTMNGKTWRRPINYLFAAEKIVCELDFTEVSIASVNMPLAFVKTGLSYHLVAINGLLQHQNLYVEPNTGRWLSEYVPAKYRLLPFLLADTDDGKKILCIDEETGAISDSPEDIPFFNAGHPTELIQSILSSLTTRLTHKLKTLEIIEQLSEFGLIKEWNLEFEYGDQSRRVDGIYCIDEEAIKKLSANQLLALRDTGALGMMYCQLLSMHQIGYLYKLLNRFNQTEDVKSDIKEIFQGNFNDVSDTLSFENL